MNQDTALRREEERLVLKIMASILATRQDAPNSYVDEYTAVNDARRIWNEVERHAPQEEQRLIL